LQQLTADRLQAGGVAHRAVADLDAEIVDGLVRLPLWLGMGEAGIDRVTQAIAASLT